MTLYVVELRAGIDCEGDQYCEILGIFDTIEKAEFCKDRYLNYVMKSLQISVIDI